MRKNAEACSATDNSLFKVQYARRRNRHAHKMPKQSAQWKEANQPIV
jgi:hypothetical protein